MALIKTKRKTEVRCNQSCRPFWGCGARCGGGGSRSVVLARLGADWAGGAAVRFSTGSLGAGGRGRAGSGLVHARTKWGQTHPSILRLQGLDALGDIAIIDVAAVNLHEMLEGRGFVAGGFVGGGQFVVQSGAGFFVDAGSVEGLLVPANGGLGQALVEEALREPGVSLHDLREGMPTFDRLAGLLQLADGFIEQAHFAEGDAEVVV